MSAQGKILVALALLAALALAWQFIPEVIEQLGPEPVGALVAIQVGDGPAQVGPVSLSVGTAWRLYAVLEARRRDGSPVYYSEAERLVIGGQEVESRSLERWHRGDLVKVLWATVEGAVPYREVASVEALQRFQFTEFLRVDWPQIWTIPGNIEPANDDRLEEPAEEVRPDFGTQRFQVRIELYDDEKALVPSARYSSWGADELAERVEEFPTTVVQLPGGAAAASRFFGLTHLEPPLEAPPELKAELTSLTHRHLAFAPVPLLAELIADSGRRPGDLDWQLVDLAAGPTWGEAVAPGDLLQAGARWVVAFRDAGEPGILDRGDLCLDFAAQPTIRPLGEVFTGEGELELARLSAAGG